MELASKTLYKPQVGSSSPPDDSGGDQSNLAVGERVSVDMMNQGQPAGTLKRSLNDIFVSDQDGNLTLEKLLNQHEKDVSTTTQGLDPQLPLDQPTMSNPRAQKRRRLDTPTSLTTSNHYQLEDSGLVLRIDTKLHGPWPTSGDRGSIPQWPDQESPNPSQREKAGTGSQLAVPPSNTLVNNHAHILPDDTVINSLMTATEIASVLVDHGCVDLTQKLDMNSCSSFAVSNGGFGDVYAGNLMDGTRVAIKVFRLHLASAQSGKHLKHAARELHTWSKCQHHNVLGLLGLVEFRGQIGMVSPWAGNGNIRLYLSQRPNVDRRQLCYAISSGLAYLHRIRIIHGDLKGANVLVSNDGTPLLTDFGNSVLSDQSLQFTNTTAKSNVSPRWTAPEVLQGLVASSYSADMFSLGMTWLETITGNVPYHELQRDHAVYMAIVINKRIPARPEADIPTHSKSDNKLWHLLTECWAYEPEHRPNAEKAQIMMLDIINQRYPVSMLQERDKCSKINAAREQTAEERTSPGMEVIVPWNSPVHAGSRRQEDEERGPEEGLQGEAEPRRIEEDRRRGEKERQRAEKLALRQVKAQKRRRAEEEQALRRSEEEQAHRQAEVVPQHVGNPGATGMYSLQDHTWWNLVLVPGFSSRVADDDSDPLDSWYLPDDSLSSGTADGSLEGVMNAPLLQDTHSFEWHPDVNLLVN